MADINKVTIVGRMTRDPELNNTKSGTAVVKLGLAVNEYAGKDKGEIASFFDVVVWGKTAEAVSKYTSKGSQIVVSGSLRQERWEKDGVNNSKVVINASDIQFVNGKKDSDSGDAPF